MEQEYKDLHGMGMEYMMQFLDEYLGRENTVADEGEYGLSEKEALISFYTSATGAS